MSGTIAMEEEEKESESPTSYHYVTDPEKCYKIQDKYGWELLGYEEVGGAILKVKCIYEGETQFPSYFSEDD
jgi:hypothetical protein